MSQRTLRTGLPFSSVIGLGRAKRALMCAAVDDTIKGVLIKGPPGTAKSVLVRSFADSISDRYVIDVPQNVTDDQLFGGIDIEKAIVEGHTVASKGILRRADGNLLYIDNINLLNPKTSSDILESVISERIKIEREGISAEYPLHTTVLATMDPSEKELSPTVSDRFDICVTIFTEEDSEVRADIVSLSMDLVGKDTREGRSSDDEIRRNIDSARELLPKIRITNRETDKISRICSELNIRGYRGDIAAAKVARALAALDGRNSIAEDDIREAAIMCLSHRKADPGDIIEEEEQEDDGIDVRKEVEVETNADELDVDTIIVTHSTAEPRPAEQPKEEKDDICLDTVEIINELVEFESIRLHEMVGIKKRAEITQKNNSGRYVRARVPNGKTADPAFDATVRVAAPYQRTRDHKGLSIAIEPQDIREKVRVRRDRCSFLFMVDVSGSQVVGRMMDVVQGAIRSMLKENYVKRDKAGLMTFRADRVDLAVPFTRSVETICDTLAHTPTGDSTPLNSALLEARAYLINYLRKHPDERCYVVIITDGQGNVAAEKGKVPVSELKKITKIMHIPNTEWTVIDTSDGLGKKDAVKLAKWLDARYITLSDLGEY
ncbi:MAG: AAA family ATPase [Candidatus Methanomethylophilaceae archaeon]